MKPCFHGLDVVGLVLKECLLKISSRKRALPALVVIILSLGLLKCSAVPDPSTAGGSRFSLAPFRIKVSMVYGLPNFKIDMRHVDWNASLAATVVTNINVRLTGCLSGYKQESAMLTANKISAYRGDINCRVELLNFQIGSITYEPKGGNSLPFAAWTPGSVATYQSTTDSEDLVNVYISKQLTTSGISLGDEVIYNYLYVTPGTENENPVPSEVVASPAGGVSTQEPEPQPDTTTINPDSVVGHMKSKLVLSHQRVFSANNDGSMNMTFTFRCANTLQIFGTKKDRYFCGEMELKEQIDYILIRDTFNGNPLSLQDALDAFNSKTPLKVTNIVEPGDSDIDGNILATGGFYTDRGSPSMKTPPLYSDDGFNNILIVRRRDNVRSIMAFLYFYIKIPRIGQD